MKKLISMTDFVLSKREQSNLKTADKDDLNNYYSIQRYAEFLQQPLTLGMFVPVDENGNILDPVIKMDYETKYPSECYEYDLQKHQEAEENVLFEGFKHEKFGFKDQFYVKLGENMKAVFPFPNTRNYTIEDLIEFEIELTESAIKQIGL